MHWIIVGILIGIGLILAPYVLVIGLYALPWIVVSGLLLLIIVLNPDLAGAVGYVISCLAAVVTFWFVWFFGWMIMGSILIKCGFNEDKVKKFVERIELAKVVEHVLTLASKGG